jgi:hypothetical protein
MTDKAESYRDPIAFTAEALGTAKTEAAATGETLVDKFKQIERHIDTLRQEHGIEVGRVQFDDPVVQQAWMAHRKHDDGPPLMDHEEDILVRRGYQVERLHVG